jgi:phenylpropionate dioxygenase-like ring-hydroxylating dioxygenase large terminal subunit
VTARGGGDRLPRSAGPSYQDLLDADRRPAPEILREQAEPPPGPTFVPRERYVSRAFHELEVERVWKRVWQMACREEEIPEVGDHVVYELADLSVVVVRAAPDRIRAFHNSCLHRGRQLREHGGRVPALRCPFHGWTWSLDGELVDLPCRWDFPHVERERFRLPELRVGAWGGFVFVNPDLGAEPLEHFLGDLPRHFARWPLEARYKEAHVAKPLACNWKVAQEAFMEAYHVVATHPQLLPGIGDASSQIDVWPDEPFSRAITANATPSPHLPWQPSEQDMLDVVMNRGLDEPALVRVPDGMTARAAAAEGMRVQLAAVVPDARELCDGELLDSFYYTLFPNLHPWAAYNRICYRFRPLGDDPNACLMEVMYLAPFRGRRPAPAPLRQLAPDEPWTEATELGFLGRVFDQDTANLARVQRGLRASPHGRVPLGNYQEAKIRRFHALLDQWLAA